MLTSNPGYFLYIWALQGSVAHKARAVWGDGCYRVISFLTGRFLLCLAQGNYEPGKRHWLKVKKDYLNEGAMADTADLVVLGAFYGKGSKGKSLALASVRLVGSGKSRAFSSSRFSVAFVFLLQWEWLSQWLCCSPSRPRPLQAAWLCCGMAGTEKH